MQVHFQLLKSLAEGLIKLLGSYCCLCGRKNRLLSKLNSLCSDCEAYLPYAETFCQQCGINQTFPKDTVSEKNPTHINILCGKCLSTRSLYQRTITSFWYQEPLQTLIQDYKFNQKLFLTPILGKLMAKQIAHYYRQQDTAYPECLIPMPIHPKRLKERGYHHIHELTKVLSKSFSIPIDLKACRRVRHTAPQSSLPFEERKKNVRHVFSAIKIPYQHVAIIDDVITTGETIRELAKTLLKKNPTLQITVWCLARTTQS